MSLNFNVGRVNSIEEESNEEKDEEEYEQFTGDSKNSNELKAKLIKMALLVVVALGALFLLLFIISLFNHKTYDYEEIESIMEKAAISYFKTYPDSLPQNEKQTAQITTSTLIATGKMKDLSKYTKKGISCDGKVEIAKRGNEYIYTPYLTCGEDYTTQKLSSLILSSEIVKEGYGLYKINDSYVYRGELVDNYVKLNDYLWRIVKIDTSDNIVLVLEDIFSYNVPWDNRYNNEQKYNSGNNSFTSSRIKETLNSLYNGDILSGKNELLDNSTKAKMVEFNLCTGKRDINNATSDNSVECSTTEKDTKIGLLTVSDYLAASIDPNCNTTTAKACQNYNYLNNKTKFWLATPKNNTTYQVYSVTANGIVKEECASSFANARAVIHLNSNTLVKSGTGTEKDPYIIK